jgi:pilus assembly protein CpaB
MSIRAVLVVGLAIICGLSAAVGMNRLRRTERVVEQVETSPVVVAAADIARGNMISMGDLTVRDWPAEMVPQGAVTDVDQAVDRAVIVPIAVGEPLLETKLADRDAGRGLAALIPKGMRAYTIQATRVASNVAGFILPGNRVDVLLTLRGTRDDGTGGGSTTTLLQAVEILAVDQNLDAPADNKSNPNELRSVTLLVTPDQAAVLDLGQSVGTLTLSLRNPQDSDDAAPRPATLADIRFHQELPSPGSMPGEEGSPAAEPSKPATFGIVTLRGAHRGQVNVAGSP